MDNFIQNFKPTQTETNLIIGAIGLFLSIIQIGFSWILFSILPVAFVLYILYKKRQNKPIQIFKAGNFSGIKKPDTLWHRNSNIVNDFSTLLNASNKKPIVVVGESGIGKTTFVNQVTDGEYKIIDNYDYDHTIDLGKLNKVKGVIFDQFEQYIERTVENNSIEKNVIKEYINNLMNNGCICIIVIKKEWYFDLKFLGDFIPTPAQSFELTGFSDDNKSIYSSLDSVCKTEDIKNIIKDVCSKRSLINPLEMQLIGAVLELETNNQNGEEITKEKYECLGGKTNIIRNYINMHIKKMHNKEIIREILYTLSLSTNYDKSMTIGDMCKFTHRQQKHIETSVNSIEEIGLIKKINGKYYLGHGYLSQIIVAYTGMKLDPIQRDNIRFFIENNTYSNKNKGENKSKYPVQNYFLAAALFVGLIKLLEPLHQLNIFSGAINTEYFLDASYVLIFTCHGLWVYYVAKFYKVFFFRIANTLLSKVSALLMVALACLSMMLGAMYPEYWLALVSIGGFAVAFNIMLISNYSLNQAAKQRFSSMSKETLVNMFVLLLLGFGMIFLIKPSIQGLYIGNTSISYTHIVDIFIYIVLMYFAIMSIRWHTSDNAIAAMVGMVERSNLK